MKGVNEYSMIPTFAPLFRNRLKSFIMLLCSVASVLYTGKISANCTGINTAFTPSQTLICGPGATTLNFINNSTGVDAAGASYNWYLNGVFFDNTSGLAAPSTSTISAVGTYNYMLIATG